MVAATGSALLKKVIDAVAAVFPVSRHIVEQRVVAPAVSMQGREAYKEPKNLAVLPLRVQKDITELLEQQVKLPARYLTQFKQVNVSSHGVIFRNLSIHIPSLVYYTMVNEYKGRLLFKQWLGADGKQPEAVGLVFDHWGTSNYFHWVVESMPRLMVLRQAQPDCVLLLPAGVPQYVRDTLALLGFGRTVELTPGQVLEASQLWFVEHLGNFWLQDAALLQRMCAEVKAYYHLPAVVPHRRVYVSRGRAGYRKVANEAQVLEVVGEAGFEVYYFEDLSFEQQVQLMHETQVLMGLHGASLTNLLWMQSGTVAVEMLNETVPNLAFFKLAGQCGMDYYCVAGTNVGAEVNNNSDILVDVEQVRLTLQQALG